MDSSEIMVLISAAIMAVLVIWGFTVVTRMVKQSEEFLGAAKDVRVRAGERELELNEARAEVDRLHTTAALAQTEAERLRKAKRTERAETLESAQISLMYMGLARKALTFAQAQNLAVLDDVQQKEVREQVVQAVHAALNRIVNPLWILQDAHDDLVRGTPGVPSSYREV